MSKTIKKTINLFDTIKQCGYDDSKKTKLNRFVISIVFRTLLLVDAFHDFSNDERYKIDKSQLFIIYKELLNSYKKDLLHIFKVCEKANDFINFFSQLFENLIHEILLKIECKNGANPHFLTIDVNKMDGKDKILDKPQGISGMKNSEKIQERIFTHLTFKEGLSESNFSSYSYPAPGNPVKKIGIVSNLPLFDTSMEIKKDETNKNFVIKKFIGKLRLNPDKLDKLLDYSIKHLFIISYDNEKEFKITDESVLTKSILIINEIFTECTDKQRIAGHTFMDISVPKLHKARDDLMKILDFTKKNKISHPAIITSPWGFVHNIICSKTNKFQSKKCRNTTNPSITFTIDAESQHATKEYIIQKLENFCQDQICTPENLERIENQRKLINETTQLIKNHDIKQSDDSEEGKKLNYIMQSIYDRIINEETKFKLATTTGSNFDAANAGNLGAYIEHHNQSFGIKHEKSHTYEYDITLVVDDKLGKTPLTLLHLIYTPVSVDKSVTVDTLPIPIKFNFVKLQIETWFSLIGQTKTHQVLVNYEGTESLLPKTTKDKAIALIKKLPEYLQVQGIGGFSLSKAAKAFEMGNNVLDLHFKTATDTGQNLCLKALEMEEQDEEDTLYILHTNDTFNGALGSLINPGTVIERTNELEKIKAQDGELEKKIDTLSDGKNNMYVTSTTYDNAYTKANLFDKIKDQETLLAKKLLETNKEMKKQQQRADDAETAKKTAETARDEMNTRRSEERQGKEAETKRADDAVIAKETAETALYDRAFKDAQRIAKEQAHKLTKQIREEQDKSDEDDIEQLFENVNKKNPLQTKVESPRTKLFGSPKRETKRREKTRKKSKKKREKKRRKKSKRRRRSRSSSSSRSSSFRRSPAQSRSPSHKRRKVQSSKPPNSNSKKRTRSSTSNSPPAKRSRRHSPTASGKKTRRKNKL